MIEQIRRCLGNPTLHHVGIVSPNEQQALHQIQILGLTEWYRGYVQKWRVLCIFTRPNGGSPLEFVVPEGEPLKKFNSGLGGIHHVALTVPDLRAAMATLENYGVKALESEPIKGAGPFLCNFLPPIYTKSFAVELVQVIEEEG